MSAVKEYLNKLNQRFRTGISREHSYRGDLQNLLESLESNVLVTNEPARIACGAPDYILTRKNIPIGYIEAKDIGVNLSDKIYKEQFDRYRNALNNLIITDYLTFQFFVDGQPVTSVSIGKVVGGKIIPEPESFSQFELLIANFCSYTGQSIKSASRLSKMMAAKARLLANIIEKALAPNDEGIYSDEYDNSLYSQFSSFKHVLIHDITEKAFADIYAQTIAYGMFAARLHDPSLDSFTRQEAAELIPKSNPFLRKLFQYIAGYDLDDRIKWIVDALADIFRATNVAEILSDFGKTTQQTDPMIHFYETFLSEYDPKLRKSRGVWYTPEPVVNFIVRAVDDILKTEFGLPLGLADTSKVKVKVKDVIKATADQRSKTKIIEREEEVHRVQILDPATGTGTFLAEVVKHIHKQFVGLEGIWNNYVEEHLIPRLNGFEILMASYAMAHLKLDMLLTETGYKPRKDQRLKIFLTNSLEEHHPDTGTLFANWLSTEANEANHIKRDTPVMVIIGNPPYSVSSSNKGAWIENLVQDYKRNLNERNIQPLSDDYIKFIRYGQHFIEKNGSGILAYISNNSFIDGLIHRQMRKNLLNCFDKIYILNLHGNAKRKEVCPDGSPDQNVFDIMQGVSINIFVKTMKNKVDRDAKLYHTDLFGTRNLKYKTLLSNDIHTIDWVSPICSVPNYFFIHKDLSQINGGQQTIKLDDLFLVHTSGIKTHDDRNLIGVGHFGEFNQIYYYRPFDIKYINYDLKKVKRHRYSIMRHMLCSNIALLLPRQGITEKFGFFLSKGLTDINYTGTAGQFGAGLTFPLYLYSESTDQPTLNNSSKRIPNLNPSILNKIAIDLGITFIPEKEDIPDTFAPIDLLDYIYAVLHSSSYREKFLEILKIDFPQVPTPTDKQQFWNLVSFGSQLRQIHLLESPLLENRITSYVKPGNNIVDKVHFEIFNEENHGKVWINNSQYFEGVPQIVWEFFIGGYQPAQKWLKDRKGLELKYEDIIHYQKIIIALTETDRLIKKIDQIKIIE